MLRRKDIVASVATFALAIGLLFSGAPVQAKSACKGLEQNPCERKDCIWVKSYTRKDGVQVRGHCKSGPSYKSTTSGSKKRPEPYKSITSDAEERLQSKGEEIDRERFGLSKSDEFGAKKKDEGKGEKKGYKKSESSKLGKSGTKKKYEGKGEKKGYKKSESSKSSKSGTKKKTTSKKEKKSNKKSEKK